MWVSKPFCEVRYTPPCLTGASCGLQKLRGVPIIAEDLGVITPDVHELRETIGAPGMVVLQFAWGSGATNTHLPHNHYENSVCYPGRSSSHVPGGLQSRVFLALPLASQCLCQGSPRTAVCFGNMGVVQPWCSSNLLAR